MQQELQLESNCTQKDLFRNSNWKKFVHLILTLITPHTACAELASHDLTSNRIKNWREFFDQTQSLVRQNQSKRHLNKNALCDIS